VFPGLTVAAAAGAVVTGCYGVIAIDVCTGASCCHGCGCCTRRPLMMTEDSAAAAVVVVRPETTRRHSGCSLGHQFQILQPIVNCDSIPVNDVEAWRYSPAMLLPTHRKKERRMYK